METDVSPPETQMELLASRISAIEHRLARLEAREPPAPARAEGGPARTSRPDDDALTGFGMADLGSVVTLLGRTLFVLAGAFLLRALTDSGRLAAGPGVLLGLAFALTWIVMADRAGGQGRAASAAFHGVAFVLIAFPLLFEATTRFRFLTPATAAVGVGACAGIALAVGGRRRLEGVAWVTTLGAVATAIVLALATARLGPFALLLVLLGVATLWLGYVLEWTLLRWPVALVANLAILVLSVRAVTPGAADVPAMALAAQSLLLVAYLGSFATRTLFLDRDVIFFEMVQSVAAIMAGLGGAAYLTHMMHGGGLPLGVATLALAAGCYGAAMVFLERRQGRRRNFYFYTSAGLVFALAGGALALPGAALGLFYAALGLTSAWAGRQPRRIAFKAHAALYLAAAAAASGLLRYVLYGLGVPSAPGGPPSLAMLTVLALCGAAAWSLGPAESQPRPVTRVPRLLALVLLLGGVLGAAVTWLMPALPAEEAAAQAGLLATVRTALLVAGILALAWADRAWAVVEGAWLVYPLLVLTGVKFLLEDFRAGRPATLFLGFALYGLALVAGPRLCRRTGGAEGIAPVRHAS